MKKSELIGFLDENYPAAAAEEWDNCGLQVGSSEGEVSHVLLALDLTESVLDHAMECGADFILTHHPMIFRGIKTVTDRTVTGRRIMRLIREGRSYYAMHTNYDVLGMAEESAKRLELLDSVPLAPAGEEEGFGRVGRLPESMSLRDFALRVKEAFGLTDLRIYGPQDQIVERAAICTGSGKSFIPQVLASGAQVYVTGDVDHHTALDAMAEGLSILDAGHYGTEYIFMEDMEKVLKEAFPELEISRCPVKFPYTLC